MESVTTASAGRPPRWGLSPLFRAAALTALLTLGACGGGVGPQIQQSSAPPERVFSAGFVDLQEIYIDDLDMGSLAETGMSSLSTIEPGVTVVRSGNTIAVAVDGKATSYAQPSAEDAEAWGQLTGEAVRHLQEQSAALGSSDTERIYETIFDALVRDLDPYSRYASREEASENRATRDGFGGIGVRIDMVPEGVKVLSVMEDTPAERSGLHDGDVIVAIDGTSAAGIDQREAVDRLRGRVGSNVVLGILRAGTNLDILVTRAHIVPQTVKATLYGNVGVIELSSFNHSTSEVLHEKVDELLALAPGGTLSGLVLDLRSNPGGLLDQSVEVADLFLDGGVVVTTHGRHPDSHQYFDADSFEIADGVPMIVLMNGNSASASEIVAAALQDRGRAVVIGSSSYGKGTVQTVLRLPNDGELTLTWARFHAPSGYPLNGRGVLPDVCTSQGGSVEGIMRRVQRGEYPFSRTLQQTFIDEKDKSGLAAFRAHCPPTEQSAAIDLDVALALLQDQTLFAKTLSHGRTAAALQ